MKSNVDSQKQHEQNIQPGEYEISLVDQDETDQSSTTLNDNS